MIMMLIYRDLKPENILVDENFRLKLADFGWSRYVERDRNTFCGTPEYLSPEMINGTDQTEKMDVWTMGILMYELLHGFAPFTIKKKFDQRTKLQMIQKNILKGIIEFSNFISENAQKIILAMLHPIPEKRPNACDLLTFPFFTERFPFLASLRFQKSSLSISNINQIKQISNLFKDEDSFSSSIHSSNIHDDHRYKQIELKEEALKQLMQKFEEERFEFVFQKNDLEKEKLEFEIKLQNFEDEKNIFNNSKQLLEQEISKFKIKKEEVKKKQQEILEKENKITQLIENTISTNTSLTDK